MKLKLFIVLGISKTVVFNKDFFKNRNLRLFEGNRILHTMQVDSCIVSIHLVRKGT